MKRFRVITNIDNIYEIDAENRDDAVETALSGDIDPIDSDFQGCDVYEVTDETDE